MEFQLAISARPDSHQFAVSIEPEGMYYEFPKEGKVVLTFRGPDAMLAELTHYPDAVIVWRPPDTEVWATTTDGTHELIGGFSGNPAPGFDTGGKPLDQPLRGLIERVFHHREP
ncbi:hypothetical protein ACFWM1_28615 [Nocardia sp. NPDC058379]|uniref:hypothetical protein n=1 Tax=unclassified Nocardia TaxID=2637762 RepID=UPI0036653530